MSQWVLALIAFSEAFFTTFATAIGAVWTIQGNAWPSLPAVALSALGGLVAGWRRLIAFYKIPTALVLVLVLAGCGGPVTQLLQRDVDAALRTFEQAKLPPANPAVLCLTAIRAELAAVEGVHPEIAGLVSLGAAGYVARHRADDTKAAVTTACDALLGQLVREGAKAGLKFAPLPF